jgi:hypothetical protein
MSQQVPPPGGGRQPTEEEMQAALSQLREAPVAEVIIDILQGLLSAAQVKIGRRDGRLLLDAAALVNDHAAGHVDAALTDQVNNALTQLRMAQVEAEKEIAASGEAQPSDVAGSEAPTEADNATPPPDEPSPTSRLWVPGR